MPMPDGRFLTFVALSATVLFGTLYSVAYGTYLDTSDPLLTHLPHHLQDTHYFASKRNPLNVYFIKRIWGWTSAAFLSLYLTSAPALRTKRRALQFVAATAVWLVFTGWFFGPPLFDRVIASTGGQCVVSLPSGALVTLPTEYCHRAQRVSPKTHAALFPASLLLPDAEWAGTPRLRRGHDVSGHIFLLTLSTMFLTNQLRDFTRPAKVASPMLHGLSVGLAHIVVVFAMVAVYATSVYFHTPEEKLTGYLLGVAGYLVSQLPVYMAPAPAVAKA